MRCCNGYAEVEEERESMGAACIEDKLLGKEAEEDMEGET